MDTLARSASLIFVFHQRFLSLKNAYFLNSFGHTSPYPCASDQISKRKVLYEQIKKINVNYYMKFSGIPGGSKSIKTLSCQYLRVAM